MKANVQCVAGLMYYITFKAEDASTATIETFQAKVWRGIGFVEVTSIRVKPISISKQGNFFFYAPSNKPLKLLLSHALAGKSMIMFYICNFFFVLICLLHGVTMLS